LFPGNSQTGYSMYTADVRIRALIGVKKRRSERIKIDDPAKFVLSDLSRSIA